MSSRKNKYNGEAGRKESTWLINNDPEYRKKHKKQTAKNLHTKKAKAARRKAANSPDCRYKNPEYRKMVSDRNKLYHKMGLFKDPFKDDFIVIVKERSNDYAGVITEDNFQDLNQY